MDHRPLQELRLRDFRCFHDQQTARLAPLTLLVGDNSTGKTSFLAAVTQILEVANHDGYPDFSTISYDLGSFPEIAHRRHPNGRHRGAESFSIGLRYGGRTIEFVEVDATFILGDGAEPALSTVAWSAGDVWIRDIQRDDEPNTELGCASGAWRLPALKKKLDDRLYGGDYGLLDQTLREAVESGTPGKLQPLQGDAQTVPGKRDYDELINLCIESAGFHVAAFPGAPIRSSPVRTYDPIRLVQDPDGRSIPALLAYAYSQDPERWQEIKQRLEDFGRTSGLFDEIFVRRLGRYESDPFQLEVRKWGRKRKGPKHNLVDVGYGVSQVLPLLVDLVDPDGSSPPALSPSSLFLLQQPEIHLHPSAQAELGGLFCSSAASGRQLIIETHSDYIIDRIRIDIRDKRTELKPDDVSILYFERDDLDVRIHSLRFDEQGNVLDAPDSYGRFFMNEMRRSVGL